MIELRPIKKTDAFLAADMAAHYSQPKGFVGRSLIYAINAGGVYCGSIAAGSTTLHLPNRQSWLLSNDVPNELEYGVNNTFFHVSRPYPIRNFLKRILYEFKWRSIEDWERKYGNRVHWFETLVELPRTGEIYIRDGWQEIGITKGYTCKRVGVSREQETDDWGGKRVWDRTNLRPKRVFVLKVE